MNWLRSISQWIGSHRILSVILALAIAAIAGAYRFVQDRSAGTLTPPVRRGAIVQSVYGIGTVTANRSYQLKPGVTGTIYNLWVKEGDTVARGSRLAQLDSVVYRAPFGGTVVNLPFKVGENVFANFPVLTLVDLLDRYLVVTLEQQGALRVRAGQKATMSFDSIRETHYDGVVQSVYSYGNAFLARIDCSTLPASVLPGMTSDVAIEIQEEPDALIVPIAALDRGNLWIKRGRAIPRRIPVKTGIVDKDLAQIVAGDVQPGDQLVLRRALSP